MRRFFFYISILIFLILLSGCGKESSPQVLYLVKGDAVTTDEFRKRYEKWLDERMLPDTPEMRKTFLYRTITDNVLYEEGLKEGVEFLPQVAEKIAEYKRNLIIETMKKKTNNEIYMFDEETLKQYYAAHTQDYFRPKLYRLYAIRVRDSEKANNLMRMLQNPVENVRFLSSRYSDDRQLAQNEGDWGPFQPRCHGSCVEE